MGSLKVKFQKDRKIALNILIIWTMCNLYQLEAYQINRIYPMDYIFAEYLNVFEDLAKLRQIFDKCAV